ncbi:MAG: hypothetical protein RLZZ461_1372 [Planctomycetota bacterium]|jgi:hypothetical protein
MPADTANHHADDRVARLALAPVLIVGAPRSGTTWLQRLLLHDAAVCGGQESHWLVHLDGIVREARRKLAMPRPHGVLCHLTEAGLLDVMRRTWIDVCTPIIESSPEATLFIEKTPDHACHLDLAIALLPGVRVVHVVRAAEDVAASLLAASRTDWGRDWAPRSAESAARRWVECVEAAERSAETLGADRFIRIRYESLLSDPAGTLGGLRRWLGLADDRAETETAVATNTRDAIQTGRATVIPLLGDAAARRTVEPDGFVGDGARPGLGMLDRRRCRAIVADTAARLRETVNRELAT